MCGSDHIPEASLGVPIAPQLRLPHPSLRGLHANVYQSSADRARARRRKERAMVITVISGTSRTLQAATVSHQDSARGAATPIGGRRVLGGNRKDLLESYPRHLPPATGRTFASLPPHLQTPRWPTAATAAGVAVVADAADGAIPLVVAAEERGGGATRPPHCPRGAGLSWRRRRLSRVAWKTTGRPGKPRWRRGRPHHRGHRRRPTTATGSRTEGHRRSRTGPDGKRGRHQPPRAVAAPSNRR